MFYCFSITGTIQIWGSDFTRPVCIVAKTGVGQYQPMVRL